MMKKAWLVLLAAVLAQPVLAGKHTHKPATAIHADDAWARPTVSGMKMGGVFLEIENKGKTDDVLVGGSTPVAEKVEIHHHVNDNGVMKMAEMEGGLPLAKGSEVELRPGSYHVMLMGLKKPLAAGNTFPLTLKFKKAPQQTVTVKVKMTKDAAQGDAKADGAMNMHEHHHNH